MMATTTTSSAAGLQNGGRQDTSPDTSPAPFRADCYALTHSGRAMPARLVEAGEDGFCLVESPGGKQYTFHADSLLPVEEAEAHLRRDRVARVAGSYRFDPISEGRGQRVIRCFNPEHPGRSNYVLTLRRNRQTCSCPAWEKSGGQGCKHLEGLKVWQARQDAQPGPELPAETPAEPPASVPVAAAREDDLSDLMDDSYAPAPPAAGSRACWDGTREGW